ncbi:MFS transporter [Actinomadura parmotrematis]|uniref:DHA2 family efflux MFS transporter permease subunit n=1 Tax=Actinomadura parmotrematis TaxID=2864039 RepID=A0ABS7FTR9_9ACTN|nr:DHA2 family efflux MFS transporter permease subunit [Actinomadura parmotrematis]MBW8482982.1 DHA2 family efflux MFS transporter permease subunit [Actinomadura parmotrematis]
MTQGRFRWALALVAISAFMTQMDNTIVTNALPTIMSDLHMSKGSQEWVATGYILMFSCLLIAGGRLADIYGTRTVFITGMSIFTGASALCGFASDDVVLIAARIVQGGGAALALPSAQVVITVGRTDKQRSIGNIVWIAAAGGATAFGPAIGGFIVRHFHWSWIFLINIVPGVLVIVLAAVVLTQKGENRASRVDLPGVLISATMLFALIYALEVGRKLGWDSPTVLGVFALAGIALVCFVAVENWAPDPMMDLRFFRNRVFVGGLASQMLWGIGFNGLLFYSSIFMQRFLEFSPQLAGLVMLPSAVIVMVFTPVAFWLSAKTGPRPTIAGGMVLMGGGMFLFSRIQHGDGFLQLMPGVLTVGLGSALCMPIVMYILKAVPERKAGTASGIINVIREASGAFGIAIIGLLIHAIPPDTGATAEQLETFRSGTAAGLTVGAVLVIIGAVISGTTLPSRRGWLGPKHGKGGPLALDDDDEPEMAVALEPTPTLQPLLTASAEPHPHPREAHAYPREPHHPPVPREAPMLAAPVPDEPARHLDPTLTPYDGLPVLPKASYPVRPYVPPRGAGGEWPPPPPEGWYAPYRPDEDAAAPAAEEPPRDARPPRPRGDAW